MGIKERKKSRHGRSTKASQKRSIRYSNEFGALGQGTVGIPGAIGLVLSALVLGTLVWVLTDYGIVNPDRPSLLSWISLIVIGIVLGLGLSWSLVRARVTGQVEVN